MNKKSLKQTSFECKNTLQLTKKSTMTLETKLQLKKKKSEKSYWNQKKKQKHNLGITYQILSSNSVQTKEYSLKKLPLSNI